MREDWVEVELGWVCGKVEKVNRRKMPLGASLLYIDIGSIDNITNKIIGHKHYTWVNAPSRAQQIIRLGDVLFSTVRTYLKNIAQVTKAEHDQQICSSGFTVIRGSKGIFEPNYLFYLILFDGFLQPLNELQTGSSYPAVRDNDVFAQIIPIPPLPEQRAIVDKIEKLFSELGNAIANLKVAKDKLEIYRQAVLKKAFEGELTRAWRKNNKINTKWAVVPIKELVQELNQGWSPKCVNQQSSNYNEWAVIKTSAIQQGKFVSEENKVLPKNLEPRRQHELHEGDILITRAGPRVRVGVCCLVRKVRPKLLNCDKVYRLKLSSKANKEYFEYKMNSLELIHEIERIKTGGNDSGLNLTQSRFLNIKVSFPPIQEQNQIVQEIETRLSVCDNIQASIDEGLKKSEALRQSILKKAFEGRLLTEKELEACRREPDWEPADKLLKKIKMPKEEGA